MDVVFSARAELMEEYKKGEHASWDPDQEIETWKKKEAVLAAGEDASNEEDEEEAAPAVGSTKSQEMVVNPEQVEPDVGAEPVALEPEETAASIEDIAKD